jgi:hypothetical protein
VKHWQETAGSLSEPSSDDRVAFGLGLGSMAADEASSGSTGDPAQDEKIACRAAELILGAETAVAGRAGRHLRHREGPIHAP